MEKIGGREMDGFIFFWFAWAMWILVTFILNKTNPYRTFLAFSILFTISTANIYLQFFSYDISLAVLFLFIICAIPYHQYSLVKFFYIYIRILTLAIAQSAVLFVSLYDPVWFFISEQFVMSFLVMILVIVLFDQYKERLRAVIISLFLTDIINAIVLKKFDIQYQIGSLYMLDTLAISVFFVSTWGLLEFLQTSFQQKNYQQEKEKQI